MGANNGSGQLLRVTLVVEETLEKWVIDQAQAIGVESYLCSYCSGKLLQDVFENLGANRGLVRIELLARPEASSDLLSFLEQLQRRHYPVTALVDRVTVFAGRGAATNELEVT
jgi:hypothetical protein